MSCSSTFIRQQLLGLLRLYLLETSFQSLDRHARSGSCRHCFQAPSIPAHNQSICIPINSVRLCPQDLPAFHSNLLRLRWLRAPSPPPRCQLSDRTVQPRCDLSAPHVLTNLNPKPVSKSNALGWTGDQQSPSADHKDSGSVRQQAQQVTRYPRAAPAPHQSHPAPADHLPCLPRQASGSHACARALRLRHRRPAAAVRTAAGQWRAAVGAQLKDQSCGFPRRPHVISHADLPPHRRQHRHVGRHEAQRRAARVPAAG